MTLTCVDGLIDGITELRKVFQLKVFFLKIILNLRKEARMTSVTAQKCFRGLLSHQCHVFLTMMFLSLHFGLLIMFFFLL